MKFYFVFASLILLSQFVFAEARVSSAAKLLVRAPESSAIEYSRALRESNMISYIEWLQHRRANSTSDSLLLDEGLQVIDQDPLLSYEKLNLVAKNLQIKMMNSAALELLASIHIKMSELSVPERLKNSSLERAIDLISAHQSLQEISSFKKFAQDHKATSPRSQRLNTLELKIVRQFIEKTKKAKGFEEAVLLIDGEVQEFETLNPPKGEHQWALLTNTFEPLIFTGTWDQASLALLAIEKQVPLADGNCANSRILSNSFEVQTQGQVFTSLKCFDSKKPGDFSVHQGTLPETISELNKDDNRIRDQWIAAGLIIFAGGALAMKDKSISLKMPRFR